MQCGGQVAALCEAGGCPLDTSSNAALSRSLEAAVVASGDPAIGSLIKSLVTRAMSEAEYFSSGAHLMRAMSGSSPLHFPLLVLAASFNEDARILICSFHGSNPLLERFRIDVCRGHRETLL
jgi:hypothetical protein